MKDKQSPLDILIVGGGHVGMTLALALTRALGQTLSLALLEVKAPLADDHRAFALAESSLSMLKTLGVLDHLAEAPSPIKSMSILDHGLSDEARRPLLTFSGEESLGDRLAAMVESADLIAALNKALTRHKVMRLDALPGEEGFVTAENRNRVNDRYDARLVVAADGANSFLRKASGIGVISHDYHQKGLVALIEHEKPHNFTATQSFLPHGPFARLPLRGNRSSLVWSETQDVADDFLTGSLDQQTEEMQKRLGYELGKARLLTPLQAWPLYLSFARTLHASRLALVGDAAHKVHPLAGLGFNLGLRDVAALTDLIADQMRLGLDPGDNNLLRRYTQWRRFDTVITSLTMDGLNRLHSNANPCLGLLRRTGLSLVDRLPLVKTALVRSAAGFEGDVPRLLRGEMV